MLLGGPLRVLCASNRELFEIRTMGKNPTDDEIEEIQKELKVDNE